MGRALGEHCQYIFPPGNYRRMPPLQAVVRNPIVLLPLRDALKKNTGTNVCNRSLRIGVKLEVARRRHLRGRRRRIAKYRRSRKKHTFKDVPAFL